MGVKVTELSRLCHPFRMHQGGEIVHHEDGAGNVIHVVQDFQLEVMGFAEEDVAVFAAILFQGQFLTPSFRMV